MKWIDWVGHYKNILSDELCNQIIDYKFDYVKSTSQHTKVYHQRKTELKWMRYGYEKTIHFIKI